MQPDSKIEAIKGIKSFIDGRLVDRLRPESATEQKEEEVVAQVDEQEEFSEEDRELLKKVRSS